jgi:dephospho-CoA kinase
MSLIVGLTGGIVSGKSTVAKMFKDLDAKIIDADKLGHSVILPHKTAWRKIVKLFGENILKEKLEIDRRKLGQLVFNNQKLLKKLNEITHPEISKIIKSNIQKFINNPNQSKKILIIEAALIYEAKIDGLMDRIILVYIDEEEQIKRLMKRDGFSREDALKRIKSQMPIKEKIKKANYVINNNDTLDKTKEQVKIIWQQLIRLAGK